VAFDHITRDDGLPVNAVSAIVQDSLGFIWFGTEIGIARFDGQHVEPDIAIDVDTGKVYRGTVKKLCASSKHRLYILTFADHLEFVDLATAVVTPIELDPSMGKPHAFTCDLGGDLWLATSTGVFYRDQTESFHRRIHREPKLVRGDPKFSVGVPHEFHDIAFDHKGRLWLAGVRGLFEWNDAQRELVPIRDEAALAIHVAGDQVYTLTSGGVVQTHIQSRASRVFPMDIAPLSGNVDLAADDTGRIWVAALGLHCYDPASATMTEYRPDLSNPFSVSGPAKRVFFDRSRRLWVSSTGVDVATAARRRYALLDASHRDHPSADNHVFSLALDRNQRIWAQTSQGSVSTVPASGEDPIILSPQSPRNRRIPTHVTTRILVDRNNHLWIGTLEGAFVYHPEDDAIVRVPELDRPVTCLTETPAGEMLIGGFGLDSYAEGKVQRLVQSVFTQSNRTLTHVFHRADEEYLLCGIDELAWWNRSTGRVARIESLPVALAEQPFVLHVFRDRQQTTWVSTYGHGIWNLEGRAFVPFSDELSDAFVYGGVEDDLGNLWFSTIDSLIRVGTHDRSWERLDVHDGLPGVEFNSYAFLKSGNGYLHFGTNAGVLTFSPERTHVDARDPDLYFVELTVRGKSMRPGAELKRMKLEKRMEFTPRLHLGYREDFVSLGFAAPGIGPEPNRFRYKVEGLQPEWIETDERRISLTDLRAGTYRVRVQAAKGTAQWLATEGSLSLKVDPAPWETWWARGLGVLLLVALAMFFGRMRMAQALALARLRQRISDDLHDDVGVLLTHITQTAQLGQLRSNGSQQQRFAQIGELSRQVMQRFRQILWTLDAKNESWRTLIARMRLFAADALRSASIEVEFQRRIDGSGEGWHVSQAHHLFLIFKEATHNVIKHAQATLVEIRTELTASQFRFVIRDNGRGLEHADLGGKGLTTMKKRARQIGARLDVTSQDGVRVELVLPLRAR